MSGEAGVEQPVGGGQDVTQQSQSNEQPSSPYAQYLEPLPESVRPLVEPAFKKWDADVTQKFQSVHSQYEGLKPWESIAQSGYDPETAQQALALMQAINDDPEQVYRALAESFGFGEQGQTDPAGNVPDDEYVDPRFQTVEEMTNAMAEILLQQENARREAAEDAELDQYLNTLKQQHGDYDEDYVLAHMQLGMTGEQAVQKYQQMLQGFQATRPGATAPAVLGSGGSLPSQSIDPAKLSSKDTRDLVAQMLAQANQSEG